MSWTMLSSRAERWIAEDPDASTREELQAILDRGPEAEPELAARFAGRLAFGTAGLRGVLGAGESRMNRAVVIAAAAGLGRYLLEHDPRAKERGVVIGYDGRHLGREFSEDTAGVLTALGIPVYLSPKVCPTPVVSYAVERLGAAAGVMVTASHNPPEYNGYKVYAGNAAQIVPPWDTGIAAMIEQVGPAKDVPMLSLADAGDLVRELGDDVDKTYLEGLRGLSVSKGGDRSLTIVYTPLHGVGAPLTEASLAEAGFTNLHVVAEQREPDGDFPTVAFPNPEEPGAMDLCLALAKKHSADLVLANDPDADRLAVAVLPTGGGDYVQLTGNETGVLLGHYLLTAGPQDDDRLVMASIVSAPMLGVIARSMGVGYEETLTGFKWIANGALAALAESGAKFVFGYEEALGYTVGTLVRDKDGIGAALLMAELAAVLKAEGKTLLDRLEEVSREHGLFVSGQRTTRFEGPEGPAKMAALMDALRKQAPTKVGQQAVEAALDYQARTRTAADGTVSEIRLPASNVLSFELAGGDRIIARPSGTEPKLKFYFDVREPMRPDESYADARTRARARMDALADAFCALAG
jgi:phosphomannomutase